MSIDPQDRFHEIIAEHGNIDPKDIAWPDEGEKFDLHGPVKAPAGTKRRNNRLPNTPRTVKISCKAREQLAEAGARITKIILALRKQQTDTIAALLPEGTTVKLTPTKSGNEPCPIDCKREDGKPIAFAKLAAEFRNGETREIISLLLAHMMKTHPDIRFPQKKKNPQIPLKALKKLGFIK